MPGPNVLTVQPGTKQEQRNHAIKVVQKALGEKKLTLTLEDLKNPPKETEAPAAPTGPAYTCVTQPAKAQSVASIIVGLFDHIPRWKRNSVVNYATYADEYPTPNDAVYAATKLIEAAEEWNSHNVGVKFKWVPNLEDAAFVLAYGGVQGTVLASAFFPNDEPLNILFVYQHGFDKTPREGGRYTNYGIMKNVFLHELGHVLGLRHEFALDPDPNWHEGGAIVLGERNDRSVMSYTFPPVIQDSDIKDTRYFYSLPAIKDFVPDN